MKSFKIALLVCLALGGIFFFNIFAHVIFTWLNTPGSHLDLPRFFEINFLIKVFRFPAAITLILFGFIAFECWRLGYANSALKRLLNQATDASAHEDVVYFYITVSGIGRLLSLLMGLGIGYWLNRQIEIYFGLSLLRQAHPILQFVALVVADSFFMYWEHRLMHTRFLWEIHKVHHAATDFNGINSFRVHPIEGVVGMPFRAIPAALLGIRPDVLVAFSLLNTVYQIAVHSRLDWGRGWLGRYLIINPSRHQIHHSSEQRYWDKNFSVLTIYDRLFGTWQDLDANSAKTPVGFDDDHLHNRRKPVQAMFLICIRWIKGLLGRTP
ncbi:MAG: sterol desaturase family protein [Burkholderiales bacterium]